MEELLASSYMYIYKISYILIYIYLHRRSYRNGCEILYIYIYILHLICLFTSFLLALNFVFSKIKMFKLLFILFVIIKQLLGNLTSDIDIYSAKLGIIRLGKGKWS